MFSSNTSAVSGDANYVEDVFSTYLYTVDGTTTQAIPNGIDLTTYGGIVWEKARDQSYNNCVTYQSASKYLVTNSTGAANNTGVTFTTNGYTMNNVYGPWSPTGTKMASWTFRKQPKFFDVVTYTGNGTTQTIPHSLGSAPGCVIIKKTSASSSEGWFIFHRSISGSYLRFDTNASNTVGAATGFGNNTTTVDPSSTVITVGSYGDVNANGQTFVAYLFAHDAGGFGLTGTDNVISCGSFTTDGSGNATVNLGYEPQWLLTKQTNASGDAWRIFDNMRGWPNNSTGPQSLFPNNANAESAYGAQESLTATGFGINTFNASATYIYIAIRRGPMKVPTDATKVFGVSYHPTTQRVDTGAKTDMLLFRTNQYAPGESWFTFDKLRGGSVRLFTDTTDSESTGYLPGYLNMDFGYPTGVNNKGSGFGSGAYVGWGFARAPGFFDIVCYKGTGSATTITHSLGVEPELIMVKRRDDSVYAGRVYHKDIGYSKWLYLFYSGSDAAAQGPNTGVWNAAPTSSVFSVGTDNGVNASGSAIVAYLFATCPGVSKVGSFTANGSDQVINCGFSAGARFILYKQTDGVGGWYLYDYARGITSSPDPFMLLNSTAAENSSYNVFDADASGFKIRGAIFSSGTFIYLAIA